MTLGNNRVNGCFDILLSIVNWHDDADKRVVQGAGLNLDVRISLKIFRMHKKSINHLSCIYENAIQHLIDHGNVRMIRIGAGEGYAQS